MFEVTKCGDVMSSGNGCRINHWKMIDIYTALSWQNTVTDIGLKIEFSFRMG